MKDERPLAWWTAVWTYYGLKIPFWEWPSRYPRFRAAGPLRYTARRWSPAFRRIVPGEIRLKPGLQPDSSFILHPSSFSPCFPPPDSAVSVTTRPCDNSSGIRVFRRPTW